MILLQILGTSEGERPPLSPQSIAKEPRGAHSDAPTLPRAALGTGGRHGATAPLCRENQNILAYTPTEKAAAPRHLSGISRSVHIASNASHVQRKASRQNTLEYKPLCSKLPARRMLTLRSITMHQRCLIATNLSDACHAYNSDW